MVAAKVALSVMTRPLAVAGLAPRQVGVGTDLEQAGIDDRALL